jgi:Stress responsive A/B Barrel Domain
MVFASKEAHDQYQEHPKHLKFIEENKENWEKVRVFDTYLSPPVAATGAGN